MNKNCRAVPQKVNVKSFQVNLAYVHISWFGNTWTPSSTPGQLVLVAMTPNYSQHFVHIGMPPRKCTMLSDALVPHFTLQTSRTSISNSSEDY